MEVICMFKGDYETRYGRSWVIVPMALPVFSVRLRKVNLKEELLTETSGFFRPNTSINKNSSFFNPLITLTKPLINMLCPLILQIN